jgi:hypothetical protein
MALVTHYDKTISNFRFMENIEDNFIYSKFKNGIFTFFVLYSDVILLIRND